MLRTIIIDDNENARSNLQSFISKHCPQIDITSMSDSVDHGYQSIIDFDPNLIFLNTKINGKSGFDILSKIQDPKFEVIFTMAFDELTIKIFEYSNLEYLVKPIDHERLIEAVKNAEDRLTKSSQLNDSNRFSNNEYDRISIPSQEGISIVRLHSIIRLESDSNYTHLFLKTGEKFTISKSLKEYEQTLPKHIFFRTHQSHLININFIKKYIKENGGYVLMEDGSEVLVARRRKEAFLKLLTRH